ncbi:MAG TPA: OB-fold domain-containing protein [Marmoricola sp.]|jgi:uncharacterized OB-fold protein|nr:OB-fold domain-containing protein [Marmoricola sp.]
MTNVSAVGTYLPVWATKAGRVTGPDEDVVTMAVEAGLAALGDRSGEVRNIVLVSRDLPLIEGGNSAAVLAGLGLDAHVPVVEQLGGAPATLDAIANAAAGTLVLAADLAPAGAGAVLVSHDGPSLTEPGRVTRSLPITSRGRDGERRDYADPRLELQRGLHVAVDALELQDKPVVVAGTTVKIARELCAGTPPELPVAGASAAVFALAGLEQIGAGGLVLAVEQASAAAARLGGVPTVVRNELAQREPARLRDNPGPDIAISLAAYDRAFEAKVRWEAGSCNACGTLAFPPRLRCFECGSEAGWSLTPLPRTGEVYSCVTVHVPVPGLPTPYSLAIVQLDGTEVRALVKVTGVGPGEIAIGDRGSLVLRRVAVRSGIPDYGYALLPDAVAGSAEEESR